MIVAVLAIMIACHLGRMLLGWKASAMMSRIALEAVRELTEALHRKLQRLAMGYFDRNQTGQILARLTGDVGSLLLFLNGGSLALISDLVLAVGVAAVMLWPSWELTLACFLVVPLHALNHRKFTAVIHERSRQVRQQASSLRALLSERLSAVRVVRSFAKDLDTPVGERGQTLSGGQRQRPALARALVADPAILLLGDCTSALDAGTEARDQQALSARRLDRTLVVASHKVSSVRDADLIVVLSGGRIVERGDHDDLMRRGGPYSRSYSATRTSRTRYTPSTCTPRASICSASTTSA